jgi:hypothetical protein
MTTKKQDESSRLIPPFFNPQQTGGSLREVDVSLIQTECEQVVSRWFHGPQDADLFIWTDEKNNVIKHQIAFCGQIVEWNLLDGIRTGVVIEQETEPTISSSETIHFDSRPQESAVRLAIDLVNHITKLDEKTKGEIVLQLRERPSFATMRPDEILRRYGPPGNIWARFNRIFRKIFG